MDVEKENSDWITTRFIILFKKKKKKKLKAKIK